MRTSARTALFFLPFTLLGIASGAAACGSDTTNGTTSPDSGVGDCTGFACGDGGGSPSGCVNLECSQVVCADGGSTTSLSGVVLDPAGKVPIYNAVVYVPNAPITALTDGVSGCDRCDAQISGNPVAMTTTDTSGAFTLKNVPATAKVPVVVQIGKWRREIEVANVPSCTDTKLDAAQTRLPRNKAEGHIPRIAVATGAADPLQCLLRKIGLDDAELGVAGTDSRVHLFSGGGFQDESLHVASQKLDDGTLFPKAETLWGTTDALSKYDVVLLSCEGNENDTPEHKPSSSKLALYDYAKTGGRLFTTHYHHVFFSTSPDPAPRGVAVWSDKPPPALSPNPPETTAVNAEIVGTFPKALAMKEWLGKQNALVDGKLPMFDARHNVDAVNAGGLDWISAPNANLANAPAVQYMSFNAPVGVTDDQVCGRVVFSNLHVGAGSEGALSDDPSKSYPTSCQTKELSAQQKALEFMLFDLSSCVQRDDAPVRGPK